MYFSFLEATGTCPADDLIPPANGGLVCGMVNVHEEYCSPHCNPGHDILMPTDEYVTCSLATGWKWSHVLSGTPLPICTGIKDFSFLGCLKFVYS